MDHAFLNYFFAVTARVHVSCFVEDVNKAATSFFFSWTSIQPVRIQLQKIVNVWWIEWDGINAIKFEEAWLHFLSVVFVAVAVVVA